jgi:hypothetical protein
MKFGFLLIAISLLGVIFPSNGNCQGNSQYQQMSNDVFAAFKTNQYNSLEKYLPSIQDMEHWIETVAGTLPVEKQREMVAKKNEIAKEALQDLRSTFESCYQQGIAAGLNWSSTKFVSFKNKYITDKSVPKELIMGVMLTVSYLGVEYNITFCSIVGSKGNAVLADRFKFF